MEGKNIIYTRENKVKNILGTFFYSLLVAIVSIYHEPWRDEAQAWLIARDLDIISLFKQMRYEGTPALWHLILFPFAKLNFPYCTIAIIHLVIAISMVYLFVSYAPFSRITKLLFIFSYYIAYEFLASYFPKIRFLPHIVIQRRLLVCGQILLLIIKILLKMCITLKCLITLSQHLQAVRI